MLSLARICSRASSSCVPVKPKVQEFRQVFESSNAKWSKWFPKHMYGGLQHMQAKLRNIDLIIEVHDARIPFSGRNPKFQESLYAIRPHILVLNKMDFIDKKHMHKISETLLSQGIKHLFWTDCKHRRGNIGQTFNTMHDVIVSTLRNTPRYNREKRTEYMLMVIGIPNCGKSSFINALRGHFMNKKNRAPVGDTPGCTKYVMEKIKINEHPRTYILDTPGIIDPHVTDIQVGMKMAVCKCLHDHNVGHIPIADFLLYFANKHSNFKYVDLLNLDGPHDEILPFLNEVCLKHNLVKTVLLPGQGKVERPDFIGAALKLNQLFRSGQLGDQLLDIEHLYDDEKNVDTETYLNSMYVR